MKTRKPIMETRKVIILTESAKYKNNCVAGIDVETGKWVRLVSGNEEIHGALTDEDITYEDGTKCEILDMVEVACVGDVPTDTQPENVLVSDEYFMKKLRETTLEEVLEIHPAEIHRYLFGTRYSAVKEAFLGELGVDYSLAFIKVNKLVFERSENTDGYLKLKVSFIYNGHTYENMSVTDLDYYYTDDGVCFEHAYLVVSIGVPYREYCYKFVAKIFPVESL